MAASPESLHRHSATIRLASDCDVARLPRTYSLGNKINDTSMLVCGIDFVQSLGNASERDPCLPPFHTSFFTSHITRCPAILKELFQYSRNDPSETGFLVPSQKYLDALLPFISG